VAASELAEVLHINQKEAEILAKPKRKPLVNVPPIVLALVVGFIIIVVATIFPDIKDTIVDIAQAIRLG